MIYLQRKRYVLIGVLLALIIHIIIGAISYYTIYKNRQEARWLNNTYQTLQNIKAFEANINGAETRSRGFVITGDSVYLENFIGAKPKSDSILNELIIHNTDNLSLLNHFKDLKRLSEHRFGRLYLVQKTSKKEGFKAAQSLINQGKGRRLMDSINAVSALIITEANTSLDVQLNSSERTARKVYIAIVSGTIFSVGLIIAMFFLLIRQISQVQNSEQNTRKAKEAEEILSERLIQQNTQLQEFAYLISHNLKAPINNLNSLLDMYVAKKSAEEREEVFKRFETELPKLKNTLIQLLEALKIKQNTNKKREKISFDDVFERVKVILSQEINDSQAEIKADFSKAPTITYSRPYLENIMLSLLSNALKHSLPGRSIQINIETELIENQLILRVSDNGQGIDLEKYGHRMFSLNKSPFSDNKESGISLFVIKSQIEALGGEIKVESIANKGTIFVVTFNKA